MATHSTKATTTFLPFYPCLTIVRFSVMPQPMIYLLAKLHASIAEWVARQTQSKTE